MNNAEKLAKDAAEKQRIIEALRVWINQRPGLDAANYITPGDVQLLEAAGVPEGLLDKVNLATVFRLYEAIKSLATFSAADVDANETMYEQARDVARKIIAEVEGR